MRTRVLPILGTVAIFLLAFALHCHAEFRSAPILDADGYYHIKISQLYWTGECPVFGDDFPWMRFSAYNDMRHDWQLLYHLLLIPFTAFGLLTGGKLSAVFFAALLVAAVYEVLRRHDAPWPWIFAALLLFASPVFLYRMHLPRPTPLFLVLFILLADSAVRKRPAAVLVLALLGMWTYNVPHSMLALLGSAVAVHTILDRRPPWKLAAAMAAGIVLGIVLHPGFWTWNGTMMEVIPGIDIPQNGTVQLWRQVQGSLDVGSGAGTVTITGEVISMEGPAEFAPLETAILWRDWRALVVVLGSILATLAIRRGRPSAGGLIFLCLACIYAYLTTVSGRFLEYAIPLAVVAGGLLLRDAFAGSETGTIALWARIRSGSVATKVTSAVAAAALLTGAVWVARENLTVVYRTLQSPQHRFGTWYRGAAHWLQANTPPGEPVFHTGWDDFAPLFFHNHANRYLVGFDPYFFYMHDPERFRMWRKICDGALPPSRTVEAILSFGTRYVFVSHRDRWAPFFRRLAGARGVRPVYRDDHCTVLEISPRRSPPAPPRSPGSPSAAPVSTSRSPG